MLSLISEAERARLIVTMDVIVARSNSVSFADLEWPIEME